MTAAEELAAAAFQLRNPSHLPGLKVGIDPELGNLLADWLDREAHSCDAAEIAARRVFAEDAGERDRWIASQTNTHALAVARAINGAQEPQPPATHIGKRVNAEDCPACAGTNPPWPFICPGEPTP